MLNFSFLGVHQHLAASGSRWTNPFGHAEGMQRRERDGNLQLREVGGVCLCHDFFAIARGEWGGGDRAGAGGRCCQLHAPNDDALDSRARDLSRGGMQSRAGFQVWNESKNWCLEMVHWKCGTTYQWTSWVGAKNGHNVDVICWSSGVSLAYIEVYYIGARKM